MNSHSSWKLVGLLALTAVVGLWWIAYSQVGDGLVVVDDQHAAPLPGFVAPDFELTAVVGPPISLSQLRGKPVVLNFWATWCPPCRAEMPYFQAVSDNYAGRVVVIGVDQGEPLEQVAAFANSVGVTYPLALDLDSRISRVYQVHALPTTFFIDRHGIVRELHTGIISQAVLEERIERLLRY
jgi:cytochrome c biogenesis protein CcmG, thiol:disulfide interchange protein DsbE